MMDDYGYAMMAAERDEDDLAFARRDCDRVRDERDQYREALVDANRRLDLLRQRIDTVRRAITDEGPCPSYHRHIMDAQRFAWPTLWHALDDLMETRA